jgi:hypothetical protein
VAGPTAPSLADRRRARRLQGIAAGALAVASIDLFAPVAAVQPSARPTLLVLIVVDQMRADYLSRFGPRWTAGLRRLLDEGAVFEQAYYPYLNTVTCAGHATLATGAWPESHGIIMNQWYDRELAAQRACTADPSVTTFTYGGPATGSGHSAAALRRPTLAERLSRRWRRSRAVTLSLKPRSAIMMAGRTATSVTWWGGSGWQSSTAFGSPRPEIASFIERHPVAADRASTWDRLLPDTAYSGTDSGVGERPPPGWTPLFPHPLAGGDEGRFLPLWEESPFSDAYLGAMAGAAVRDFKLGQRGVVDFLGVSFSANDLVGHSFGPDSHEVQDVLARLDQTLGRLLQVLDREVGRRQYALALSADHGVATVPEVRRADVTSGRVPLGLVRTTVERALAPLGAGPHVARVEYTQIYLTPASRARLNAETAAPAIAALRAIPGVAGALWVGALDAPDPTIPPALMNAIRASHVPDRSGDLVVVPAPHWIFVVGSNPAGGDGTTHGSPHPYDQHVPVVFLGASFAAGRYAERVSPADVAPTLAATVGMPVPGVEGRVLSVRR